MKTKTVFLTLVVSLALALGLGACGGGIGGSAEDFKANFAGKVDMSLVNKIARSL